MVAVPLNQHLPAVVTACVLEVFNLARQIPGIDVTQPYLLPIAVARIRTSALVLSGSVIL